MKKIILLLFCSTYVMAQISPTKEFLGKMMAAKVIGPSGTAEDVLMKLQIPDEFKNRDNRFVVSTDGGKTSMGMTGAFQAFWIDGNIWTLRPSPTAEPENSLEYVILTKQGAIEEYKFITSRQKESEYSGFSVNGRITHKLDGRRYMASEMSDTQVKEWISDSPEVLKEYMYDDSVAEAKKPKDAVKLKGLLGKLQNKANDTRDYGKYIQHYNIWYEQQNPGKLKYVFINPPAPLKETGDILGDIKKRKEDRKKELDERFAGRTSTASPDMASAKDNVPVKKETFASKMQRIKSDGNKIGVLLRVMPVAAPKPTSNSTTFGESLPIEGEYMDESLKSAGPEVVQELNQALGTTDIELIDLNKIPYREVRVLGIQTRVDDWWATKYKVVFICTIDPQIKAIHDTFMKDNAKVKFKAELNFLCSMVVMEYIGAPTSNKQDIITQVQNYGFFTTSYSQDDDMKDVKQIYDKLLEKLNTPILEKMKAERVQGVKKLVEKRLAP